MPTEVYSRSFLGSSDFCRGSLLWAGLVGTSAMGPPPPAARFAGTTVSAPPTLPKVRSEDDSSGSEERSRRELAFHFKGPSVPLCLRGYSSSRSRGGIAGFVTPQA